jgi:hypothetical protein
MFESATDLTIDTQDRDTVVFFADALSGAKIAHDADQLAAGRGDDTLVSDDMADLMACVSDFEIGGFALAA